MRTVPSRFGVACIWDKSGAWALGWASSVIFVSDGACPTRRSGQARCLLQGWAEAVHHEPPSNHGQRLSVGGAATRDGAA